MQRGADERLDRSALDDLARVHHGHVRSHRREQREVVADVHHGHVRLCDQGAQQGRDLRLRGHVQPGRRLVEDQRGGMTGKGQRQGHPLLLPTAQLVRVAAQDLWRIGELDRL
jgi:hypothetical protein